LPQTRRGFPRNPSGCTIHTMRSIPPKILVPVSAIFLLAVALFVLNSFRSPGDGIGTERFVVSQEAARHEAVQDLRDQGFIRSTWAFNIVHPGSITPGGYRLSKDMGVLEVAGVLSSPPYMRWVTIPEGFRKEQTAELLAQSLDWTENQKTDFITQDTEVDSDTAEGVYFPDTYLIPIEETTARVAKRLRNRFDEKFAPYAEEALEKNIRWPTLVKIASLIEREAAGKNDMELVSGILWNRLLQNQKLQLDATVQYARDTVSNYDIGSCEEDLCPGWQSRYHGTYAAEYGWWKPISVQDKNIRPFNTYVHPGLPERPISNPGLDAIRAALRPAQTDCLYYIHEDSGIIHCSATYEGHLDNIERHLK